MRVYRVSGLDPVAYLVVRAGVGQLCDGDGEGLSLPVPLDDMPPEFLLALRLGQWPLAGSYDGSSAG